MDSIISTNLHSTPACDLNTKFNDRCYSDWSKTNLISLVSAEGIYILKPQPEQQDGPFEIYLIRNPTTRFSHTQSALDLGPLFDKKWSTLDNQQYMQVFLDPALTTHVSNLSLEHYPRRFRMVKWSPVIESFPRDCILAALTIDYQLLIFAKKNEAWVIAHDLSSEFDLLWNSLCNPRLDEGISSFEATKIKLHSLSFRNICWHQRGKNDVFLFAATIPGDIVIWRLVSSGNDKKFDFHSVLRTQVRIITTMQVVDELLIISSEGGQVALYDLTGLFDTRIDLILLDPTAIPWPQDNIEVMDLYVQRTQDNSFRIVLSKSTNICWCIMNYVKDSNHSTATLSINDSFSAIDVASPATWIRPAGDRRAVFIADDSSFCLLEFLDDRPDTSPEFSSIRTGRIDLTKMVPRGLCTSDQGYLITMISAISLVYEPSKIVAPTKVAMVPTSNEKKFFVDCLDNLLNETWLANQDIQSTMDVCDRIDYVRSIYPNLTFAQFFEMHKTLKEAVIEIGFPKSIAQLVKLKISAFLIQKLSSQSEYQLIAQCERVDFDRDVFNNILMYYIKETLSTTSSQNLNDLTQDQVNSLRNYSEWLHTVPQGRQLKNNYCEHFTAIESGKYADVGGEQCPICHDTISFEQPDFGICHSGHRFARCARTLLIVDLQKGDKLFCGHCRRHYLSYLVWSSADLWPCIYCQ